MKDKVGEGDRHQDAQLVDGDNDAGKAVLQRAVIAQPGRAGGDAGQTDKAELVFGDLSDLPRLAGNKDHHPGHQQHHRLKRLFAGRFGQITKLRPEHVEKAESWFRRYQGKAVLICRCIPIVRSLISIPAGFAKMPIPGFLLLTTLGSAVWNTVLVCIGSVLGSAWEQAMPYFDQYTHIAAVVIVLAAVVFAVVFLLRRRKKAQGQKLRLPNEEESL